VRLTPPFACAAVAFCALASAAQAVPTELVSSDSHGHLRGYGSKVPALSQDGRVVAFSSSARLVHDDTNGLTDIYVRDLRTDRLELASVSSNGLPSDGKSYSPAISADGRFVAFASRASNLANHDTNKVADIFVHDLRTGKTQIVSVSSHGAEAAPLKGTLSLSRSPSISADGRLIAFESYAKNLAPHDANGVGGVDVFVRDTRHETTTLASGPAPDGRIIAGEAPSISADGSAVVFISEQAGVVIRDLQTDALISVASTTLEIGQSTAISGDGSVVAFDTLDGLVPNDVDKGEDVYIYDVAAASLRVASVGPDGAAAGFSSNPSLSADGELLAFESFSGALDPSAYAEFRPEVFVHDLQGGSTTLVSANSGGEPVDKPAVGGVLAGGGNFVAYATKATNLGRSAPEGASSVYVAGPLH
jgi:Tol biopolymer transport system component